MPDAITVLLLEHRQVAKLLHFLDEQYVNALDHVPLNFRLLDSIFDYLVSYPAECHHPKEDLIFRRLLKRNPGMAPSLKSLIEEHWRLAQATRDLQLAVRDVQSNPDRASSTLLTPLKAFVDLYHHHMRMEEEHFFPLALQKLPKEDWAEIDFTLFNHPDRFVTDATGNFAAIYEAITELGSAEVLKAYQRDEAIMLANIHDITSFNLQMRATGEHVLLSVSADGYQLDCSDGSSAHIPSCDESRAVWCAYFFWKANAMARATA